MEMTISWAREQAGPWHRVSGAPEQAGLLNTLCGDILREPRAMSPEPPLDGERCRLCQIEGEEQPPNH